MCRRLDTDILTTLLYLCHQWMHIQGLMLYSLGVSIRTLPVHKNPVHTPLRI